MGSSSGVSSGSSEGGSDDIDERKRKRLISNRESARRSRMRKRKHVDDLAEQVGRLVIENGWIVERLSLTGRVYLDVVAENSVLRARVAELSSRLESLIGIIEYVEYSANVLCGRTEEGNGNGDFWDEFYVNVNNQPMMAHVVPLM